MYNNKKRPITIYKVSAPCGTGKSFALLKRATRLKPFFNSLIVLPSIDLIREQQSILKTNFDSDSVAIHSEDGGTGTVLERILDYLNNAPHCGEILFITWESYRHLPYIHNRNHWKIFIDEIPQIDFYGEVRLVDHPAILTDILTVETEDCPEGLGKVIAKKVANNGIDFDTVIERGVKRNDTHKLYADLLKNVDSEFVDVFVPLKWWRELETGKRKQAYFVPWLAMMNPSLFEGATILGANIEKSILYQWFSDYYGVEFRENKPITQSLLDTPDYDGRIEAVYLTDYRRWSKTAMESKDEDGNTLKETIDSVLCDYLKDDDFLLCVNREKTNADNWKLESLDGCQKIETVSRGLNKYHSYNNVVYLPALNRNTHHIGLLNKLGIDSDCIYEATGLENLYQTLLRTSLRLPESTDKVTLIVPTKHEIEWLEDVLNCKIKHRWIGDNDGDNASVAANNGTNVVSISSFSEGGNYTNIVNHICKHGYIEKKRSVLLALGFTENEWKRKINKLELELVQSGIQIVTIRKRKGTNKTKDYVYYVADMSKFEQIAA